MITLAERTKLIKPSVTLAIAAKAGKLRSEGVDVVNFSAGEPDFDTPDHIKAAAVEALRKGMTKYTDVKGIEPLRAAIAHKYEQEYGLRTGKKTFWSVAEPNILSITSFKRSSIPETRSSFPPPIG